MSISTNAYLHGLYEVILKKYGEGITISFGRDYDKKFSLTIFDEETFQALKEAIEIYEGRKKKEVEDYGEIL